MGTARRTSSATFAGALLFTWILFQATDKPASGAEVRTGIDILIEHRFKELRGKRIGLITNQTGRTRGGASTVETLAKAEGVELAAVFSPEHGLQGLIEDQQISSGTATLPNGKAVPLYSLYGSSQAPTAVMLAHLDALVFDIQDIGARFYTYAATMGMAMEAAAAEHKEFYVLDRPNPITGRLVEGLTLAEGPKHLTAYFPVPVRHGLTIGEIARLHVLLDKVNVNLRVVAMKGWSRGLWYDETGLPWIRPSPNMPDIESALLYPGIGCFEPTNLSVGRGTPHPFLWIGAPWLDAKAVLRRARKARLAGVWLSAEDQTPSKNSFQGRRCHGISIRVTNRDRVRALRVFAVLATAIRDAHPKEFQVDWPGMRRMVGSDRFRDLYESGASAGKIIELFDSQTKEFLRSRKLYLLY